MPNEIFSVTSLNLLVKQELENNSLLQGIKLKGEISSYKQYPSGHIYLSLKDSNSTINCVIWNSYASRIKFIPKIGDEVIAFGSISVFQNKGSYQLTIYSLELFGKGSELEALRKLAEKLASEGLFDESRKKAIPAFPLKIGVIAGENSAGMKDIIVNIENRYPLVELFCFPALVQGINAPKDIIRAIELASKANLDTLIIGRGGGSNEDLAAFNDEELVRKIASLEIPVISAVGHEIDTTLCDLVASKRVSTPTAAAVASTPDIKDIYQLLDELYSSLNDSIDEHINSIKDDLVLLSKSKCLSKPEGMYEDKLDKLGDIKSRLDLAFLNSYNIVKGQFEAIKNKLEALNPYSVLNRGYAINLDDKGNPIVSITQANIGEKMKTYTKDGIITSIISEKESKNG